jgi:hypothetical protein
MKDDSKKMFDFIGKLNKTVFENGFGVPIFEIIDNKFENL